MKKASCKLLFFLLQKFNVAILFEKCQQVNPFEILMQLFPCRQLDDEDGSFRYIFPYPDKSVMIGDYGVYDGEPKAGTALFRGEVGFEKSWPVSG